MQSRAQQERDREIRLERRRQRERVKRNTETSEERGRRRDLRNQRDRKRRRQRCLFLPESETVVKTQVPAVVQETGDSRAPPVRVFNNGKEYPLSACNNPPTKSHNRVLGESNREFCDWNLPLPRSSDTAVLSDVKFRHSLNTIDSSSKPMALNLGEDLPNQVANLDKIGQEKKERSLDYVHKELRDPGVRDAVCCLLNLGCVDPSYQKLAAQPLKKQCDEVKGEEGEEGGGRGGGSTSKASQVQWVCGGDDDLLKNSPKETLFGHITGFVGFKEKPKNDARRDIPVTMPATTVNDQMLPQFNQNCEDFHLEDINLEVDESTLAQLQTNRTENLIDDQFLNKLLDSSLEIEPTEEMSPFSNLPVSKEAQSDDGQAFDFIHPKPVDHSNQRCSMVGIAPMDKSIPHSQVPGNNTTAYLPLASPSPATPYSAPTPSPIQPASVPPPLTPLTPSPLPPTPSIPQLCGFFQPNSFIKGEKRVCELAISSHMPQEKRNTPIRALYYAAREYQKILQCMDQNFDLKVASDVRAKMCSFEFHPEEAKIAFTMPKDCKPLSQLLSSGVELKDRVLILQQVINTLATIHTLGHEEKLSLWGSFMVWVAPDMRVYLLVDFPLLFQKQQEFACSPRRYDVEKVQKIFEKMIAQNTSWVSPGLCSGLYSFRSIINDVSSSDRMAEAARILGEKRICQIDVGICNPLTLTCIYCYEHERLQSALGPLVSMLPKAIAHIWEVRSIHPQGQSTMRAGDVATADRRMQLSLVPCMHPSDPRALYIENNTVDGPCTQQQT